MTSKQQYNLHDSFFKQIFKQQKYLAAFLRLVFTPTVLEYLDLEQMAVQDGEIIKRGGRQLHTDLVANVGLKGTPQSVALTFIFEHKSYKDPNALLQVMEYFIELTRKQTLQPQPKQLIIPFVLLCCKDKGYEPPTDYLRWVFGKQAIPKAAKVLTPWLPKLFGKVLNIHALVERKEWTEASSIGMLLYGISNVWNADDPTIKRLFDKAHALERDEGGYLIQMFNDYYVSADNSVGESDFERIERDNCPEVKEKDRIMQQIHYFGPERWKREGLAEGKQIGIEQGIEKGQQQSRRDTALRMLELGMNDSQIQSILQISAKELAKLKQQHRDSE